MITILCMLILVWFLPNEGMLRASLTRVVAVGANWRGLRLAAGGGKGIT